ncbi:hypothetical protein T484DRAFT_1744920 [Baffinella frigidus]|nr:hypothetical protein T484DRAFT_1744920 [Cryptophyta sp. CCMP2293]
MSQIQGHRAGVLLASLVGMLLIGGCGSRPSARQSQEQAGGGVGRCCSRSGKGCLGKDAALMHSSLLLARLRGGGSVLADGGSPIVLSGTPAAARLRSLDAHPASTHHSDGSAAGAPQAAAELTLAVRTCHAPPPELR